MQSLKSIFFSKADSIEDKSESIKNNMEEEPNSSIAIQEGNFK